MRRIAARQPQTRRELWPALDAERTDTVRSELVRALIRGGESEKVIEARLAHHQVGRARGSHPSALLEDARRSTDTVSQPDWELAGRRERLVQVRQMGERGDPSDLAKLTALLRVRADPSYGFALRSEAARSLGRLGDPAALSALLSALKDEEALGRGPGAGLGIQRPVQRDLVWALGEIGNPAAAPVLIRLLDSDLSLPSEPIAHTAAIALYKLGRSVLPWVTQAVRPAHPGHGLARELVTLLTA